MRTGGERYWLTDCCPPAGFTRDVMMMTPRDHVCRFERRVIYVACCAAPRRRALAWPEGPEYEAWRYAYAGGQKSAEPPGPSPVARESADVLPGAG